MDGDSFQRLSTFVDDVETANQEQSNNAEFLEKMSSDGEVLPELRIATEALLRVELDLACSSEKLVNLNILLMHVATKENDCETFASEKQDLFADSVDIALEFDVLAGILDSEAKELNSFLTDIQSVIVNVRDIMYSCENLGPAFTVVENKLHDSEESLKQSQIQVSEMRQQSAEFQTALLSYFEEEDWHSDKEGQSSNVYATIKMHSAEQQRRILKMLEKSLAQELDLEKKLTESKLMEDELNLRLHSSEREVFSVEEEVAVVWQRLLGADNVAEVMMGISKELLNRLQISEFDLSGLVQRESELKLEHQDCLHQLKSKEDALQKLESCSTELHVLILKQTKSLKETLKEAKDKLCVSNLMDITLKDNVCSFEKQLKQSEFLLLSSNASLDGRLEQHGILCSDLSVLERAIEDLKEYFYKVLGVAKIAETKRKLSETNVKLDELCVHKVSDGDSEKVVSLEEQLKESNIQLQHLVDSSEANQEKQSMLNSAIEDMGNVIDDLKLKISKAEMRAVTAEENCMLFSNINTNLNDKVSFLRRRVESLEKSLHQLEGTKKETAKGISLQAKVITDWVMQLAVERERLYRQSFQIDKAATELSVGVTQTQPEDSTSNLSVVRTIDLWVLNFKHVLMAIIILLIFMVISMLLVDHLSVPG